MPDVYPANVRSAVMRAVRSKGNRSTELRLIRIFKGKKITGWRRNYDLFGRPDFVFPKQRIAVFADGCFWHGHNCRNVEPRAHSDYWQKKAARNRKRDRAVSRALRSEGWKVVRLWECQIGRGRIGTLEKALLDR
ncbi:MAG: very short patch repair endonuclease [Chloroflexota bacterium]